MRASSLATTVVTLLVVAGLTLSGAASGAPAERAATPSGGTLRVASPLWIRRLDPALSGPLAWQLLSGTCATLIAPGEELQPEAASGPPMISRDRRIYVFTVRRGLRFSDGSPLTAANFAHALGRVLDPAMRAEAATIYADIEHVSAQGRRLRIELERPRGDLLVRLSLPNACPVPLGFPVDPAGVAPMVGSGPYYISRLEPFERIVLERNRYYRGPRPARIERLVYTTSGELFSIVGPYNVTGISDTASRRKIFTCRPTSAADEVPCAGRIIRPSRRRLFAVR